MTKNTEFFTEEKKQLESKKVWISIRFWLYAGLLYLICNQISSYIENPVLSWGVYAIALFFLIFDQTKGYQKTKGYFFKSEEKNLAREKIKKTPEKYLTHSKEEVRKIARESLPKES